MNIYIFRGKSATGKTTLTNILSQKINIPVLRKDDIFDQLSKYEPDIAILNTQVMIFLQNRYRPASTINRM